MPMILTKSERKERLGYGAATEIAKKLKNKDGKPLSVGHVAQVLNGQRHDRDVEVAAARRLRMKVEEAFPEYYAEKQTASQVLTPD